jgi:hypothetical protein
LEDGVTSEMRIVAEEVRRSLGLGVEREREMEGLFRVRSLHIYL